MAELIRIDHSGVDLSEDADGTPVHRNTRASPADVVPVGGRPDLA